MTPERWQRVETLYHQARDRAPADRSAFLVTACAEDEALRRNVESLLAESDSDDGFLSKPPMAVAAHLVPGLQRATMIGRTLGGYRVQALIGAGGMGEVYQARDDKLARDVAIKILPSAFTGDPDRLARFEREARMLALLNHPNICAIYGFEEADGIRFLILELVEGDTLAHTLAPASGAQTGGAIPVERALGIARQIADALEAAHDKGIVHRDLKPANITITPDGTVKVLDFGLAKAVSGDGSSPDLTRPSPSTPGETRGGAVIGTAAYMSPEQARGQRVDRRTDIWAFGCVFYEMLTGRVAFPGDTVSDSIARILEREPDWSALPSATPASIRRLLLRTLAKDPKRRLRDIGDVRIEIDAIDEVLPGSLSTVAAHPVTRGAGRWPWVALATLALATSAWLVLRPVAIENPLPSEGFTRLTDWAGSEGFAEISPDGKVVAFLADLHGEIDFFSIQLGAEQFINLTESARSHKPCFHPALDRVFWRFGEGVVQRPAADAEDGGAVVRWHAPQFSRRRRTHTCVVHGRSSRLFRQPAGRRADAGRRRRQKRNEDQHQLGRRRCRPRESSPQSQHGLVARQRMDLFRQRKCARLEPPGQRDGHLASRAVRRRAGATDLPEHIPDVPGAARSGHARLRRARPARGRIVALVSRRRQPADIRPVVGSRLESFPAGFRRESINIRRCRRAATVGQWSPREPTLRRACGVCRFSPTGKPVKTLSCRSTFRPNGRSRHAMRGAPSRHSCFSCRRERLATGCGASRGTRSR